MIAGYLLKGKFVCFRCIQSEKFDASAPAPVKVCDSNFGDLYSQICNTCRKVCIVGQVSTNLFPIDDDPLEFRWVDMQQLLVKFDKALHEEDYEAVASARLEMYERILRAIKAHKLQDTEMVLNAVGRIMETATKW